MRVTLSSVELSSALKAVSKAISPRPINSMLSNVLFTTEDNCLIISATDLTTFISLRIPANIIEHGLLCVPFFLTNKMIEVLPSCELTIKSDEDSLMSLSYGASNRTIQCIPCDEFPEFPVVETEDHIIVDSNEFIKAFKALIPHVSKDATKQSLQGVHLGDRRLTAIDGHKIAFKTLTAVGGNPQAIMNPSLIKFIPSDLVKNNKLISIEFGGGFTRLSLADRAIIQRQYEGKNLFDFKPPMGTGATLIANRKQLLYLLDLASVSASQDSKAPTCSLSVTDCGTQLEIESSMSLDSMIVNGDNSGHATLVNIKYLTGLLKSTDNKEVEITLPGNLHDLITVKAGDLTLGCMPIDPMPNKKVGTAGAGYAPAWELPYEYDNGLIVTASRYGFTKSEDIPVEKTLEYKKQQQEEERIEQLYFDKVKTYYQDEPIELLKASLGRDGFKVEKLLKKHYKTIKNYNQKFVGCDGIRTWSQAMETYNSFTIRYQEIVSQVVTTSTTNESQPVTTSTTNESQPGSITVAELKLKYGSFKDAKVALGIKAVSWEKLADKLNAQSTPQIVTNSQPSVEKVIAQLKAKYGKLAYAKCELKIKAVSWIKLAETYMSA